MIADLSEMIKTHDPCKQNDPKRYKVLPPVVVPTNFMKQVDIFQFIIVADENLSIESQKTINYYTNHF